MITAGADFDVSVEQWAKQIDKRNREISENGEMSAFI